MAARMAFQAPFKDPQRYTPRLILTLLAIAQTAWISVMSYWYLVFLGGGLGSLCRYALGVWVQPWQDRFPTATLLANGLACVVLGVLLGWQAAYSVPTRWRLLLGTGFCGGFSTFSTFTAETWQLGQSGHFVLAMANVGLNLLLCTLGFWLGWRLSTLM